MVGALLVGCSSSQQNIVGTWKGEIDHKDHADNIADGFKSFISGVVGPMTYEFNDKGRYKLTVLMASQEGSYRINGNEVKTDSDDGKNHETFVISPDGKSISAKKDFKSDGDLVLKKQAE